MRIRITAVVILSGMLGACGTMNSHFSCDMTAGDSCLTIEQVDAMTRFADDVRGGPAPGMMKADNEVPPGVTGQRVKARNGQSLWVANTKGGVSWG